MVAFSILKQFYIACSSSPSFIQQDQLIIDLQSGNEKAFERLYQLYSLGIYGIIFSVIR